MSLPAYLAPRADSHQNLRELVASSVKRLQYCAQDLTPAESQFLSDVARRDYSAFKTVEKLADIARYRCKDPAVATAVAESIRGYILRDHPGLVLPWFDTLRYEGATNALADEAIIEMLLRPECKAAKERVVETHVAQSIASRAVADLIHQRGR